LRNLRKLAVTPPENGSVDLISPRRVRRLTQDNLPDNFVADDAAGIFPLAVSCLQLHRFIAGAGTRPTLSTA
jgi:hypothetical protein